MAAIALVVFQLIRRYPKRAATVWIILIVLGVVVGSTEAPQPQAPTAQQVAFPLQAAPACTYVPDPYAQPGGIDWGKLCTPLRSRQP